MHMAFVMPAYMQRQYAKKEAPAPMDPENKQAVDFLKALGLTEYESKALCSLFAHSDITASDVSQFSGIPVTKVYSVLDSLEGKGLVRYTPSRPKKYRPLEPDAVLDALMRKQEEKLQIIRECKDNVTALLDKFYDGGKKFESAGEKVWVAPTEKATLHAVAFFADLVKTYSYAIGDCDIWLKVLADQEIGRAARNKAARGVNNCIILPLSILANIQFEKLSTNWVDYLAFENIHIRALPDANIFNTAMVADDRYVIFSFKAPMTKEACNAITIDDSSVATGLRNYFEMLWSTAQPIEDKVRAMARKELETRKTK